MQPKPSQTLATAEAYRKSMEVELDKLNKRIASKLRDDLAHLVYQGGDGWCISYEGRNALISAEDLDQLLAMKKDEALAFLEERQI